MNRRHDHRIQPHIRRTALWQIVATPIVALLGVLLGHALSRRSAKEADKRWRREKTMRTLRWACEQTGSGDDGIRELGFAVLGELVKSELLQKEDERFIEAVAAAAIRARATEYGDGSDLGLVKVVDVAEVSDGQNAASDAE